MPIFNSFGGHVISAMATDLVFSKVGKIDRLSLLDPGGWVTQFKIPQKYRVEENQYGLVNRVRLKICHDSKAIPHHTLILTELCQFCGHISLIKSRNMED